MLLKIENCAICGKILVGRVKLDAWGNYYCASHEDEYPNCKACHRLVCDKLTGGGVKYNDGRIICNLCRKTSIDTKEQAKPVFESVAQFLYDFGLRFKGLNLHIALGSHTEYMKLAFGDYSSLTGPGRGQILGLIMKRNQPHNGKITRQVEGISVLYGLPCGLFSGVVAHELGHAWLYLAKVDGLPDWAEEGFCNLLSYLLYKNRPIEDGEAWVKMIEDDPSPVYGEGFQKVRKGFRRLGFEKAMEELYTTKQMPSG